MQSQGFKGILKNRDNRLGHESLTRDRFINPVTNEGRLQWTALNRGQRNLSDEASAKKNPEAEGRAHLTLTLTNSAAADKTSLVLG
jgi:hypothetical protein